ncbi:hypothetical protein D9M68_580060 [compost metagenome]
MIIRRPDAGRHLAELHPPQADQGFQIGRETCRRTRPAEVGADIIIAAALGNRLADARHERREHHPGVIVIATQLTQIKVQRQLRVTQAQRIGNRQQVIQRSMHIVRRLDQASLRQVQHFTATTELGQGAQHRAQRSRQGLGQQHNLIHGLALHRIEQLLLDLAGQAGGTRQAAVDTDMTEIHVDVGDLRQLQGIHQQADDLHIAGRTGIAIQLGAQLDRAARGGQRARLGMHHAAGITQPARPFAAQRMRIDPRHLRRDIGTKAHLPARQRVGHLEGAQIQIPTRAGKQRLQVFDMRRHHEFIAPALEQIQHLTARDFDARRFRRQYFFDAIW